MEVSCWFGDESGQETKSDSSSWKEVDRKKQQEEKKRKTKQMRKRKEEETAIKARSMLGVGPISEEALRQYGIWGKVNDCTVLYSTVQCSTVQYSTVRAYMPTLALLRVKEGFLKSHKTCQLTTIPHFIYCY